MSVFLDRHLETLDSEALLQYQWARLETLARAAVPANAFITAQWKRAGLADPKALRGWEDFHRLPLTGKSELMEDQAARPPFGSNLSYPLDRYVRVHQTSGTTGAPLRWLDTQESWEWWARCWGFVLRGASLGPGDRIFFPFSFGLFVGFWAGFEGARALGALAIPGGGQDSAQRLAAMETLGATAVCCTPSYALHLAEIARERGVALERLGVRTTVHAGEPGAGIPAVRARIEAAWGARAYDHAGMTEMGAYGFECAAQARAPRERGRVHRRGHRPRHRAARGRGRAGAVQPGPRGLAAAPLPHRRPGEGGPHAVRVWPHLPPPRRRHPGPRRRHADRPGRQRVPLRAGGHREAL